MFVKERLIYLQPWKNTKSKNIWFCRTRKGKSIFFGENHDNFKTRYYFYGNSRRGTDLNFELA